MIWRLRHWVAWQGANDRQTRLENLDSAVMVLMRRRTLGVRPMRSSTQAQRECGIAHAAVRMNIRAQTRGLDCRVRRRVATRAVGVRIVWAVSGSFHRLGMGLRVFCGGTD
jgi:hypothetical protein